MKNLKTQIKITMVLGFLSLLSGTFAHLALTDIYHMEVDVSLEWNMVRISAIIIALFIGAAIITLMRNLKEFPEYRR